ncbi:MAG TPA: hypothetical protein VH257_24120 [Chloroflexota bacterium]|nr:hypothetical protein [Chloroflexota bacterium]
MVYALDVTYCARCRIGTVDEQGLCSLCGAPQRPPSALGRLAEAGDAFLATLLQPAVLALLALGALLLLAAAVSSAGVSPPAGVPGAAPAGAFSPQATLAAAREDPVGAVLRFLLPVIVQAILFGLLMLTVVFFLRRRRPEPPSRERRLAG